MYPSSFYKICHSISDVYEIDLSIRIYRYDIKTSCLTYKTNVTYEKIKIPELGKYWVRRILKAISLLSSLLAYTCLKRKLYPFNSCKTYHIINVEKSVPRLRKREMSFQSLLQIFSYKVKFISLYDDPNKDFV